MQEVIFLTFCKIEISKTKKYFLKTVFSFRADQ